MESCPIAAPSRPQGRERNVVVTMWDWADPKVYPHDDISTDKRNPTVNANGPVYGALEESGDYFPGHRSDAQRDEPSEADRSRPADAELCGYPALGAFAVLGRSVRPHRPSPPAPCGFITLATAPRGLLLLAIPDKVA